MSKFEQKPGQGVLFKNDRKEKDTHPDYTGTINIGGNEWRLSAWIKTGQKGKFMSLAASEPYQKEQQSRQKYQSPVSQDEIDSDIPF